VPEGAKCVLEGAKCVPEGAKCVPEGAKCVPEGAKCVLEGAKCVLERAKCVPERAKCVPEGAMANSLTPIDMPTLITYPRFQHRVTRGLLSWPVDNMLVLSGCVSSQGGCST
jgi:hypothetical protein